jgi:hypothetical protein
VPRVFVWAELVSLFILIFLLNQIFALFATPCSTSGY